MNNQFEVLREEPGGVYTRAYAYGQVRRTTLGAEIDATLQVPRSGIRLVIPAGIVRERDVIGWMGRHWRVEDVEAIPPYAVQEVVTARKAKGEFPVVTEFGLTIDGFSLTIDGQRVLF